MKFLIQKIEGEIRHDFSFTLLESIRFKKWLSYDKIVVKFAETYEITDPDMIYPNPFKSYHKDYVPVGSVDFVTDFLMYFYNIYPKPINVPEELFPYAKRAIFNDNHLGLKQYSTGKWFVKSNDGIKKFAEVLKLDDKHLIKKISNVSEFDNNLYWNIPEGNYQISEFIDINSEWRCFVYQGKLVGLQNYSGEFTLFPDVDAIDRMIGAYKSSPIAYTLDVGVNNWGTFVIECHEFFSCSNYGMSNHNIYPNMLYKAFKEIINKNTL